MWDARFHTCKKLYAELHVITLTHSGSTHNYRRFWTEWWEVLNELLFKSFLFTDLLRRTENKVSQNVSISVLGRKVRDTPWPSPLERESVEYWNIKLSTITISEISIVLRLKIQVLWNITLYVFVNSNLRFGGVCCLTLQGINTVPRYNTGLFISPSEISELDCATTKTDTGERSI